MSRSSRGLAVISGAALVSLLSGCVSLFLPEPPPTTSTPTGEQVAPELREYYEQTLEWSTCGDRMQCATALAPLDWDDPQRESIELALVRSYATGDRLGSLLVNPGGPGASGVDFVRDALDFAVDERLKERFDIVGFDPRGVGRSSAVRCYDDPTEFDAFLFDLPTTERGSDARIAENRDTWAALGQACLEHTGELLGFVDTTSAAHDLDLLRAVLGDEKLHYLGYSYGTLLGASYAELYPDRVGRLVLDGAIDPSTSLFDVSLTQARGFESAFRAYLEACLAGDSGGECPFRGSIDSSLERVSVLLDRLDASPLRASDGRALDAGGMFTAIVYPLYSQGSWWMLDDLFDSVFTGSAEFAMRLVDAYYGRDDDGTYLDNSTEAFFAINCLDYVNDNDDAALREQAALILEAAPTFGPYMSYDVSCHEWPVPPKRIRDVIDASGSAPILVVGTTNDPATPYEWSVALAEQLENGHLVTYDGEGHTAYNKSNRCVNDVVDDYLIDGAVPSSDPHC